MLTTATATTTKKMKATVMRTITTALTTTIKIISSFIKVNLAVYENNEVSVKVAEGGGITVYQSLGPCGSKNRLWLS